MYWLKSCPRCSGDLAEQEDIYGKDLLCVQCGFRPAPVELFQMRRRFAEERRVERARRELIGAA